MEKFYCLEGERQQHHNSRCEISLCGSKVQRSLKFRWFDIFNIALHYRAYKFFFSFFFKDKITKHFYMRKCDSSSSSLSVLLLYSIWIGRSLAFRLHANSRAQLFFSSFFFSFPPRDRFVKFEMKRIGINEKPFVRIQSFYAKFVKLRNAIHLFPDIRHYKQV